MVTKNKKLLPLWFCGSCCVFSTGTNSVFGGTKPLLIRMLPEVETGDFRTSDINVAQT